VACAGLNAAGADGRVVREPSELAWRSGLKDIATQTQSRNLIKSSLAFLHELVQTRVRVRLVSGETPDLCLESGSIQEQQSQDAQADQELNYY